MARIAVPGPEPGSVLSARLEKGEDVVPTIPCGLCPPGDDIIEVDNARLWLLCYGTMKATEM